MWYALYCLLIVLLAALLTPKLIGWMQWRNLLRSAVQEEWLCTGIIGVMFLLMALPKIILS